MREHEASSRPLPIMGWREWVALPDLGVRSIKAKLDTGARTSSIHAFRMHRFASDGHEMVRFEVHPVQRSSASTVEVEARVLEERSVRDSSGRVEIRPVIETALELAGRWWPIELTLTRRDEMGFRMLLGRQALRGRVLVDPGASFAGVSTTRLVGPSAAPKTMWKAKRDTTDQGEEE